MRGQVQPQWVNVMLGMERPPPELLPIGRPRCPECQARMITSAVSNGAEGMEQRTFKCGKCGHTETRTLADPLRSDAVGWTNGELRPPR
ncbi:MJ0042-type zinc finger domain-containing protein [Bradyrhizobium sp. LA6.10]|uniref:MJ0042-type zinc finger domain-containing protein n=1 Tax=Bradyrhizobium sp. LA6.10 TaxID=3156318 RepID=UPI003399FCDB